jgi:AraC-like DNA-binding protein
LTQRTAKQMIKRGEGRIVWVSRREGLNAIARRWGFTDASNFTRIFRATFDMSPREWREINRRRPH